MNEDYLSIVYTYWHHKHQIHFNEFMLPHLSKKKLLCFNTLIYLINENTKLKFTLL